MSAPTMSASGVRRALALEPRSAEAFDAWCRLLIEAQAWDLLEIWAGREAAGRADLEPHYRRALGHVHGGRHDMALPLLRRLAALVPAAPAIWTLTAEAAERGSNIPGAGAAHDHALALAPEHAAVLTQAIGFCGRHGRSGEALRRFGPRLLGGGGPAEATVALAETLIAGGLAREGRSALMHAAEVAPGDPSAPDWLMQAAGHAMSAGDLPAVATALRRSATLAHGRGNTWSNLSEVIRTGDPRTAARWAHRALALEPLLPQALGNVALAHQQLLQLGRVEPWLKRALAASPDDLPTHVNLSHIVLLDGRAEEAERWAARALAIDRSNPTLPINLGIAQLTQGKLLSGYRLHEHRLFGPGSPPKLALRIPRPRWNGEPLQGRSLLIWNEQGIGDQFYFARYLPMVRPDGGTVVVECDPRLLDLYQRSFPDFIVVAARPSVEETLGNTPIDLQIPVASLPLAFLDQTGQAVDAARAGAPWPVHRYFKADPAKLTRWEAALPPREGRLRVAISWRGGNLNPANMPHYMPADHFADMLRGLPVTIVNVQYSSTAAETDLLARELVEFIDPPLDLKNDLDDVAAILACCDLLITAHTAVMYLAAAQGVPTWSFLTGRSWSTHGLVGQPLFPSIRHFTKSVRDDWSRTVSEIRSALIEMPTRRSVGAEPSAE